MVEPTSACESIYATSHASAHGEGWYPEGNADRKHSSTFFNTVSLAPFYTPPLPTEISHQLTVMASNDLLNPSIDRAAELVTSFEELVVSSIGTSTKDEDECYSIAPHDMVYAEEEANSENDAQDELDEELDEDELDDAYAYRIDLASFEEDELKR
jgi:hypothetical protein